MNINPLQGFHPTKCLLAQYYDKLGTNWEQEKENRHSR